MNRDQLNRLRRMAGLPQDFTFISENVGTEAGVSIDNPDSVTHPTDDEMAAAMDAERDVDAGDDAEVETPEFELGDHVMCGEDECVVVAAAGENVVVVPVGAESDIEAIKIVHASELEKVDQAEEPATDDAELDDEVDAEVDGDESGGGDVSLEIDTGEGDEEIEEACGRDHDSKMTPSLSRKENKRNKKAMNSKERQKGRKQAGMMESMHYHADDGYETFADHPTQPVNVTAPYPTVFDTEVEDDDSDRMQPCDSEAKVHVPAKVLNDLKAVIDDCKKTAAKAEGRDDERMHYYADTADALQIVHDCLSKKTILGMKEAQLYSHRMANVSRHLMPDHVWKFIIDGGVKRSLKDYMNDVKGMKYPIEGPRNKLDDND